MKNPLQNSLDPQKQFGILPNKSVFNYRITRSGCFNYYTNYMGLRRPRSYEARIAHHSWGSLRIYWSQG